MKTVRIFEFHPTIQEAEVLHDKIDPFHCPIAQNLRNVIFAALKDMPEGEMRPLTISIAIEDE